MHVELTILLLNLYNSEAQVKLTLELAYWYLARINVVTYN